MSTSSTLQEARDRIDEINQRVVELLAERQEIVDELCAVKAEAGQSIRDRDREAELLSHVRDVAAEAGLSPDLVERLFEEILDHSVRQQRERRYGTPSDAPDTDDEPDEGSAPATLGQNGAASPNGQRAPSPASSTEAPGRPDDAPEGRSYHRVTREHQAEDTVIRVRDVSIGAGGPALIAGPCSVESRDQILRSAEAVAAAGGHLLRGGCFKPRTSPYSFQGLGEEGLDLLVEAGDRFGLPVITEVLAPGDVDAVAARADVLQIGARNMQNFALLKAVGNADRPVMLKRGMMASIEEWLAAAEYIVAHGNPRVFLCERGIQTFESATRYTLDLSSVPVVQERSHLPVVVDPSHATGTRRWVAPLVQAAIAGGADGVMIEVHPNPDEALSDGDQSLPLEALEAIARYFAEPVPA